jgi:hypothetical protein
LRRFFLDLLGLGLLPLGLPAADLLAPGPSALGPSALGPSALGLMGLGGVGGVLSVDPFGATVSPLTTLRVLAPDAGGVGFRCERGCRFGCWRGWTTVAW